MLTLRGRSGAAALEEIGFRRRAESYVHVLSRYSLDFPPGPLAVGDEVLTTWATERRGDQVLHVLTPFDCVRDRVASFLYWNDLSGLMQAVEVHSEHPRRVNRKLLKAWFNRERQAAKFDLYEARLRAARARQKR